MAVFRFLLLAIMALTLFACASTPKQKGEGGADNVAMIDKGLIEKEPDFVVPKPAQKTYVHNAAVKRLISRAQEFTKQQHYDAALRELERGLAIAPNNPYLWQNLALVRLKQGRYAQAEQLATKSNALSQDDEELKAINADIISEARSAQ